MSTAVLSAQRAIAGIHTLRQFALAEQEADQDLGLARRPTSASLPFTVRLVNDNSSLSKAVQIRHAAYARHVPDFAEALKMPEASDFENGVAVLLAESKLDATPLGTMRIQTNRYRPLTLEKSVALPEWLHHSSLAEATRLAVANEGASRMVKTVLFKSFFLYCQQNAIDWMVITARAPIDRQYDQLLFNDVYPGLGYVPMAHVNNLPHRVMSFEVDTARARWAQAKHPLFDFIFTTTHPDIQLQPADTGSIDDEPLSQKPRQLAHQTSV